MSTDEEIGAALRTCRGDTSQARLADLMKIAGFRWSQATVWAIEAGARPLRYSEALALKSLIGFSMVEDDSALRSVMARDQKLLNKIRELILEGEAKL